MNLYRKASNASVFGLCFVAAVLLGIGPRTALGQFDFRESLWEVLPDLEESWTVGCVTVDVDPDNVYSDHHLFWDSTDGLGVTTPDPGWYPPVEPDEIDSGEQFQIRFCRPTYVAGIGIADLYPKFLTNGGGSEWVDWVHSDGTSGGDGSGEAQGEIGWVVPDGLWEHAVYFYGEDSDETNGEQYVPLGMVVTTLEFHTICSNSDYSVIGVDPFVHVQIDIKPGSYPNSINLKSKGVVPVAILTSDSFDATTVDPVSVLFACAAPVKWAVEDVDGDSDQDMILHFKTQELTLTAQSIAASLTGRTLDGVYLIKGMDTVKIVGVKGVKCLPPAPAPGTATPGYWKNHPEAWPVSCLCVGDTFYCKERAIDRMKLPTKGDKTLTLFPALVAAKLNVYVGNDSKCVEYTIMKADCWMNAHPVGSGVKANSMAWKEAEPLYLVLDAYNNGLLCAPSRDMLESE